MAAPFANSCPDGPVNKMNKGRSGVVPVVEGATQYNGSQVRPSNSDLFTSPRDSRTSPNKHGPERICALKSLHHCPILLVQVLSGLPQS